MLTDQDVQMTVDTYQQILIRADTIFQNEDGRNRCSTDVHTRKCTDVHTRKHTAPYTQPIQHENPTPVCVIPCSYSFPALFDTL